MSRSMFDPVSGEWVDIKFSDLATELKCRFGFHNHVGVNLEPERDFGLHGLACEHCGDIPEFTRKVLSNVKEIRSRGMQIGSGVVIDVEYMELSR